MSSLFKGIKAASSQGLTGDYLKVGRHRLKLIKAITRETRKKADAVIFNVEVIESNNPAYLAGAKSSIFIQARVDTGWLGDVKNVVMALLSGNMGTQVGEDAVDEEVMTEVMAGDGTLLAGTEFYCDAFEVTTKAGRPFTKYPCTAILA